MFDCMYVFSYDEKTVTKSSARNFSQFTIMKDYGLRLQSPDSHPSGFVPDFDSHIKLFEENHIASGSCFQQYFVFQKQTVVPEIKYSNKKNRKEHQTYFRTHRPLIPYQWYGLRSLWGRHLCTNVYCIYHFCQRRPIMCHRQNAISLLSSFIL